MRNSSKVSVAVAVALLGMSVAAAAVPAGSLPGSFQSSVSATYTGSGNTGTINVNASSGQAVMQWGGTPGVTMQAVNGPSGITTNAGFDVGQGATLNITNQSNYALPILVVDDTRNPSEIAGTINGNHAGVLVANPNGVTVDGTAIISAPAFLAMGYLPDEGTFEASNTIVINGSTPTNGGTVTIAPGANLSNVNTLLVAGNGNVNIGASNISGSNAANNVFDVDAGAGVNITTTITQTGAIINPKATLTVNGGTSSSPVMTDFLVSGGSVNVTGALGGDPAYNGGELDLTAPTAINIAQSGSISGSVIKMGQYNLIFANAPSPQSAPNITIAGSLNATGAIQFDGANNVYESGSGTVNVTGGTNIYANLYGNMANPSGGQAHGGDWRYNGLVVNVNPNGSTASDADTVGLVINPLSLGTRQQFINVAVNGSANLFNWNMGGTIPANLVSSPLSVGGSVAAQAPAVTAPDHLVVTANNILLGNSNFSAVNYYFPGLLALVTDNAGDPTTVGGGQIIAHHSVSNVVPWSIPNGGGMYLTTNTLSLSTSSTFLVNDNSYVNFPAPKYTAQYALFPNTFYGAVNNGSSLGTQALPSGDFNTYAGWNDPSAG